MPRERREPPREKDTTPVNERIRSRELRVVDENGEQLGIMPTVQAIDLARQRGFDLVEVASGAVPPVARIMDYGKYKYQIKKKQHEAKKKQSIIHVKEVKMRPGTDQHDFDFKVKHAERFLAEGDKVKVLITFRGREIMHKELGHEMMERVVKALEPFSTVEAHPKLEGRNIVAILAPKAAKH
jgi:translation initiation factor IF-3